MDDATARNMRGAADKMNQAARNFGGYVDQLARTLEQFSCDMAAILNCLESLKEN